MASVGTVKRKVQTIFKIELVGDNLPNNHMAKIIKWSVNDFKKKYPLLLRNPHKLQAHPFFLQAQMPPHASFYR